MIPFVLAGWANAGSSYGPVTTIYAHAGDVIFFAAGSHQGKPGCSVSGDEWAFSLTTPTGKAMYALLLSAQAQGKFVSVTGNQGCAVWGDRENPLFIVLTP